uniref:RRM domain-containing protein n=2 Tax=Macrostomum lignano TaxID=282301 RepID=A0A1I8H2N1_9PLAT
MQKMNGQLLGNRAIRTNWAVRKPQQTPVDQKPLNYDEVAQASSTANSTVYVGGITRGLCEELLREAFKEFGAIMEVRVFKEKGYAFIRFDTHEGATRAIITMHGKEVGGQPCKCSWGKESNEKDGAATLLTPYSYYAAAAAAAAAAANPLAYPGYASQLAFLQQQPLNPYATAAAYPTASGAMLNGYATVSSSQLLLAKALMTWSMCTFVLSSKYQPSRWPKVQILRVSQQRYVGRPEELIEQRLAVQHEAAELRAAPAEESPDGCLAQAGRVADVYGPELAETALLHQPQHFERSAGHFDAKVERDALQMDAVVGQQLHVGVVYEHHAVEVHHPEISSSSSVLCSNVPG